MYSFKALQRAPVFLGCLLLPFTAAAHSPQTIDKTKTSAAHEGAKLPVTRIFTPRLPVANAKIPIELKINRLATADLQSRLFRNYGIIAVNRTDEHSAVVLRNLLFLLNEGFPRAVVQGLNDVKFLLAFASHDRRYDLAAFHPEEHAISIGGLHAYPESEKEEINLEIMATLAHELGHAYLLEYMSAAELGRIAKKFGGWEETRATSLYADNFFLRHPGSGRKNRSPASEANFKKHNIVSQLGARNQHEWFADAFAAYILSTLGERGLLGKDWRARLAFTPASKRDLWVNYNYIQPEFFAWFAQKLKN